MSERAPSEPADSGSLSTRRGFVAAASFGAVGLYGLWAAYGAAPFGFSRPGLQAHDATGAGIGHGSQGSSWHMPPEEFRRLTADFVERHRAADGVVEVEPAAATDHAAQGAGHAMQAAAPAEIYMLTQRWSFEPALLRLRAGAPYLFRMMAVDVSHGASIQLGRGSRITRLRQGALVEQELTFTRPGEYLVYCTVYCGIGHDRMSGRVVAS